MHNIEDVLKALSDQTRLRIINMLYYKEELCVCDIVTVLDTTQTKVSRHLAYLKNSGLVSDRKYAQWSYYSLNQQNKAAFIQQIVDENLKNTRPYNLDLEKLNKWLETKRC